jgi:hypothetical protein
MCMRTEEEIAERELIGACFHEISHGVVADHFGVFAEASVWNNENYEATGEKAWLGQCQMRDLHKKFTTYSRRMVSMAGFIGEEIALAKIDKEPEENYIVDAINKFYDPYYFDLILQTDRGMIGIDFDEKDIGEVVRLVLQNWEKIDVGAKQLKQRVLASDQDGDRFASMVTATFDLDEFFGIVLPDVPTKKISG